IPTADGGDARIVDQHVDPPPASQDTIDQPLTVRRKAHIALAQERIALLAQQSLGLPGSGFVAGIIDGQRISMPPELQANAPANAATSAGDQGDGTRGLLTGHPSFTPSCRAGTSVCAPPRPWQRVRRGW